MDISSLYELYRKSGKVSTDTRQIIPGSIFFALKGPNFNANTLAAEALEKGANYAIIDDDAFAKGDRTVVVPDVLLVLQQLAKHHRRQLTIPVFGLTGSNGKTTTKELLFAVLSRKFKTLATKGNLNNHIGVPLTLLSIDTSVELAIVEMGANHVGEIAMLCAIADPTHGMITNIGKAHIGTFGGYENILRAKSELYQHLINTGGQVFINSQSMPLANMAKRFASPLFYPARGDYYQCSLQESDPYVTIIAEKGEQIRTHLTGRYNFENIAAALCVGKYFGVDAQEANSAVAGYLPTNMRSQIIPKDTNTIIMDAYNANPSSMEVAIENLAGLKATRKVAVLGDMFELGDDSEEEHRKLGVILSEKGLTEVYLCGEMIAFALETFPTATWFDSRSELLDGLKKKAIKNATILIKASRGMGLEKVLEVL